MFWISAGPRVHHFISPAHTHSRPISSPHLPKELDVQDKQYEHHNANHRTVLVDHGLPRQLLGAPLELLRLLDQIAANLGHVLQLLSPIQHLLNVLLHDGLDVGQVLVELGGILPRRRVDELPLLPLDVLIELDELVRPAGRVDGPAPIVAVIAGQLFEEAVGYFFEVDEGQPFGIGGLGEGEVADGVLDEVVKDFVGGRCNGHSHGLSIAGQAPEDLLGLPLVGLGQIRTAGRRERRHEGQAVGHPGRVGEHRRHDGILDWVLELECGWFVFECCSSVVFVERKRRHSKTCF
mmetsp:Transcript_1272/g.3639  ORF Transcript_1272/g.3639 Transcript_1272/m.3639 type:complete len:293 (-) Transcript_1272:18-896(-)